MLLVTMHHIVADGWSLGVLVRELAALYAALRRGAAGAAAGAAVQYADYALWQRELAGGRGAATRQLAYWKRAARGRCRRWSCRRTGRGRRCQSHRGATHAFVVPAALTARCDALAPAARARRCS